MEIWEPKLPGTLWATPGLLRDTFTLTFYLEEMGWESAHWANLVQVGDEKCQAVVITHRLSYASNASPLFLKHSTAH